MTPEELRAIAKQQNDDDFAAGRMATRHVEDGATLLWIARLILTTAKRTGRPDTGSAA
jgi:hypothetical protein